MTQKPEDHAGDPDLSDESDGEWPACKHVDPADGIVKDIAEHGRSVMCVAGGNGHNFFYSVGNHLAGLPDLLVIGGPMAMGAMINTWSDMMAENCRPFEDDELIDIGGRYPCRAHVPDESVKTEYMVQAGRVYGRQDYKVLRIVTPDKNGRFSDDPLCEEPCRSLGPWKVRS